MSASYPCEHGRCSRPQIFLCSVVVTGVNHSVSLEQIRDIMGSYGKVTSASCPLQQERYPSKRMFITFGVGEDPTVKMLRPQYFKFNVCSCYKGYCRTSDIFWVTKHKTGLQVLVRLFFLWTVPYHVSNIFCAQSHDMLFITQMRILCGPSVFIIPSERSFLHSYKVRALSPIVWPA